MYPRPRRLIVAQYTAPANLSLVAAAELLGEGRLAMAAQIVDLAVRKVVTIARPPRARRRRGFTIALARDPGLEGPDEQDVLRALFGPNPRVGASIAVRPRRNQELGKRLRHPHRRIVARLITRGLAQEKSLLAKLLRPWRKQPIVATHAAAPVIDHLWGIHDYVKVAERFRFAALQSPDGAQRSARDIVQLNEKLLPFAVLFGVEKQWAAQLDVAVEEARRSLSGLDVPDLSGFDIDLTGDILDMEWAADLGDLVDLGAILEGVGAIFGGIVEGIFSGLSP
jgi:hypothetical protein